jgi:predicted branched-subunit amino acid permease
VFPLVFLGLAVPLLRSPRHWITAGIAVAASVLAVVVLPSEWRVTAAAIVAAVIGSRFK